jgi:hypothetical protein
MVLALRGDSGDNQTDSRKFYITLSSPIVGRKDQAALEAVEYQTARAGTLTFRSSYVVQGAQFSVPEP